MLTFITNLQRLSQGNNDRSPAQVWILYEGQGFKHALPVERLRSISDKSLAKYRLRGLISLLGRTVRDDDTYTVL